MIQAQVLTMMELAIGDGMVAMALHGGEVNPKPSTLIYYSQA